VLAVAARGLAHHLGRVIDPGHEARDARGAPDVGAGPEVDLEHVGASFESQLREHPLAAITVLHSHHLPDQPAQRSVRTAEPAADAKKKVAVVRAASRHSFLAADVDQIPAEIERGYLGRRP
jgi:hypothetical protein